LHFNTQSDVIIRWRRAGVILAPVLIGCQCPRATFLKKIGSCDIVKVNDDPLGGAAGGVRN
jgi:hypothetical protein